MAAATLPGIFLAPIIGLLADRYGRRRVLVPCLVVFGVAGGAGLVAPNLAWLVTLRFFQGAGSAGLINLAVVVIGDHWTAPDRSRMIGYNAGVLTAGLALLPTLGGVLTGMFGWRAPFAVYPVALVVAAAVHLGLTEVPRPHVGSVPGQLRGIWEALRSRRMALLLGLSFLSFALIFAMLLTVLPVHLDRGLGIPAERRGILLGLPALATFAVSVNLGRLVPRLGRARLLGLGTAGFAVGYLGLGLSAGLGTLVPAVLVAGMAEGALIPTIQDAVVSTGRTEERGSLMASFVAAARAGQTIGPLTAGALMGAYGTRTAFLVGAAVAGVMAGTAGLIVRPGRVRT
ncbi:MAG: MFS transporter [Acidimicrobiia bacterium]|nr:MAG: MFS transporter [Acidimicrobiia bacterium]